MGWTVFEIAINFVQGFLVCFYTKNVFYIVRIISWSMAH